MVVTRRMAATERIRDNDHSIISKQMKKVTSNGTKTHSVSKGWSAYKEKIQSVIEEGWALLIDPSRCSWWPIPILLLLAEVIINIFIIEKVKYTEIDWRAYMQASILIFAPTYLAR